VAPQVRHRLTGFMGWTQATEIDQGEEFSGTLSQSATTSQNLTMLRRVCDKLPQKVLHRTELTKSAINQRIRVNDAIMDPLWVGVAYIAAFTFNLKDLPCVC
jgi:hypothetical protein